jgi:hypothetical protein
VGLIARHAEAAGITTLCMSSALDISRAVNPPRAAFLDFPLGHTTGKPDDPALQHAILVEALRAFSSLDTPGMVLMLPFRWAEDEVWKHEVSAADMRTPRLATPQYQEVGDRERAELGEPPHLDCRRCRALAEPDAHRH